jgi:DNA (cytosine-5)-methyltransferase 1
MLTVGSLFAGIGGFDLGFDRAGFDIKWQVEIDPFCRAVLAQHWPDVRRYDDVRDCYGALADTGRADQSQIPAGAHAFDKQRAPQRRRAEQPARTRADGRIVDRTDAEGDGRTVYRLEPVDVICGGFPCQPHSLAGRRGASTDDRDLWPQFARLIRELRPRWVVAENVPGLLSSEAGRFFGTVLGDLAACGYDAEWQSLPASAFGAPHRRDRVWLVAYPDQRRREVERVAQHADECGTFRREPHRCGTGRRGAGADVADAECWEREVERDVSGVGRVRVLDTSPSRVGDWRVEPDVGRVAHGVPARVDRLRGLGNAIVPQIAEWIARRILAADGLTATSPATSATVTGL